ncbi:hypothetical protein SCH4B_1800 [Ruegeria sp. TrichCH4B]|nr:hypothetical protein SCH4B_1800 [Ruegeria sp. TrichCH4B]
MRQGCHIKGGAGRAALVAHGVPRSDTRSGDVRKFCLYLHDVAR